MFERFTPRARRVVVAAQEEARSLQHNYIGTEHLLLGLLAEPGDLGARALGRFGMALAAVRVEVTDLIPVGKKATAGHIPFTPRSKKVLELALREALILGHNYIGTEHILLGVIREGQGPGALIIAAHAGDLRRARAEVLDLIPAQQNTSGPRWLREPGMTPPSGPGGAGGAEELRTTPAAETSLTAAIRAAGSRSVGSHHLMVAALSDPHSAAVRALTSVGIDMDRARRALLDVDVTGTTDEPPEEAGRRQMTIRLTGDQLVLETADPALIELAQAALDALGSPAADGAGAIRGDLPASVSLGTVWQALRESLEHIRRRAADQEPAPEPAPEGTAPDASDAAPEAARSNQDEPDAGERGA